MKNDPAEDSILQNKQRIRLREQFVFLIKKYRRPYRAHSVRANTRHFTIRIGVVPPPSTHLYFRIISDKWKALLFRFRANGKLDIE